MNNLFLALLFFILYSCSQNNQDLNNESLPPLSDGIAPQSVEELWEAYDPRREPMDVEILKEWEEEDVVMQVLRYRAGIFKGKKAMIAAIYGYPKEGKSLPALVQAHGGGQYADYRAVLTNAKRGYATISISWAGRINAPDYKVSPDIVKLFWENKTDNPEYKITTDWGSLDGYHAPYRNKNGNSMGVAPNKWTLDAVDSPRNASYFLWTLAARRALTFLEQQEEIDPDRLGIYGHSMGAKITVLTAGIDKRVKAAAPSCGGISRSSGDLLYSNTLGDSIYLAHISCPIIFLSPANDFHGNLGDIPEAVDLIKTEDWRIVSSAHLNHQDYPESEVTALLWFDHYLKGCFSFPEAPETVLELKTKNGIPTISVIPDASKKILEVDVFYIQQEEDVLKSMEREYRKNRYWHHAKAVKGKDAWTASLPLASSDKTLWAYAHISYDLYESVTGAGYYYRIYTAESFNLSSLFELATPDQLEAASVKATLKPSTLIEDFKGDWKKDWFVYKPDKWELKTHKVFCDLWTAPSDTKLGFGIRCAEANKLVVSLDKFAKELELIGGNEWQHIVLNASDFKNADGEVLPDWSDIKELTFSASEQERIILGDTWKGEKPEFRNLHWSNLKLKDN